MASAFAQQYPSPLILWKFLSETNKDVAIDTMANIPVRLHVKLTMTLLNCYLF